MTEPQPDFWERTFDEPRAAKIGCYGFLAALCVGLILLTSMCSGGDDEAAPAAKSNATGPNEIDIVSACDLAVRASLKSESSFDPDMRWTFRIDGSKATVTRKFEAANSFGASLTSTYFCEWDDRSKRVTSISLL